MPFYEVGGSLSNVKLGLFSYNRAGTNSDLTTAFDYFRAGNTAMATGGVGGTVPATLALSLGTPARFGAFTPGRGARLHGVHDRRRPLHRG